MHELAHFSIPCADVERAKRFYEAVFGWHIEPWGPPNYYSENIERSRTLPVG